MWHLTSRLGHPTPVIERMVLPILPSYGNLTEAVKGGELKVAICDCSWLAQGGVYSTLIGPGWTFTLPWLAQGERLLHLDWPRVVFTLPWSEEASSPWTQPVPPACLSSESPWKWKTTTSTYMFYFEWSCERWWLLFYASYCVSCLMYNWRLFKVVSKVSVDMQQVEEVHYVNRHYLTLTKSWHHCMWTAYKKKCTF